jgi:hypothetical protein
MATTGTASREAAPPSESTFIRLGIGGDCGVAVREQTGISSLIRLICQCQRTGNHGAFVINRSTGISMNETNHWPGKLAFMCGSAVLVASTGCTVYDVRPPSSGAYYESSGPADAAYAEISVESDFYEPLSPYGRWETVGSYGRCWIPGGVGADWSPYSEGYWQDTDAGWYWVSDEPWGWATYHYGRWDSSPQFGWYWVPQRQWAPAWVSWREGGGYVGWAPMGPSGRGVVAYNRRAGSDGYVVVEERRFLEPVRRSTLIVNRPAVSLAVIGRGPETAVIERASGRKMQPVPVRQLRGRDEAKVVARHPIPTAPREKAAPAPTRPPVEKAAPARESRPAEKPAQRPMEPPPPAAKRDVRPADEQHRVGAPDAEKRAPQEKTRSPENKPRPPMPAAEATRPENKPESKPEARPAARPETRPEPKREPAPEAKRAAKPEAKVEPKPATERAAAPKEQADPKAGKDDEKKN